MSLFRAFALQQRVTNLLFAQSTTSFECDGCGHHASFHSMENEQEQRIISKWAEEDTTRQQTTSKKRRTKAITSSAVVYEINDLIPEEDHAEHGRNTRRTQAQHRDSSYSRG